MERRLKQMGQTPAWLARKIEKPKQSIYQWLDGANPRDPQVWADMAAALGLSTDLLTDDARDIPSSLPDEVRAATLSEAAPVAPMVHGDLAVLPVWRGTVAGSPNEECVFIEPDSPEFEEVPALLIRGDVTRHVLCVAAGTSMSPRVRQGERAIVRLNPNPPVNTLVIAESPTRQRFIKALREKTNLELHSLNTRFDPIKDLSNWMLIGSVVAILHDYEVGMGNIEWDFGRPLRA